ncbi:CAP domain-containing protein [Carnobacterium sp. ISL-102]|uniref:CAP domain-containing protein n=1 Tax=Carnobacterium sp. ISL-102 TaxID=2819142 RepID=UPI001BEC0347|nr:CAP domain-containing protein [Carnobacterium sp. ISL-102]MBT2732152.1 CAP domain-containing protein [Carnobacterium sp. ISL-102]
MRKFFSYSLMLVILISFGYWLGSSTILEGTKISDTISQVMDKLPSNERVIVEEAPNTSEQEQATSESSTIISTNDLTDTDEIDVAVVENRVLELLNNLRKEVGVSPVSSNDQLKKAANIRAIETEESFSHTRPDGRATFTVLEEPDVDYSYQLAGENLAMGTYYLAEKEMAEWLFKGLKESPGHYENMVKKDFEEVGIGVHYNGENLYVVQLFGTPR